MLPMKYSSRFGKGVADFRPDTSVKVFLYTASQETCSSPNKSNSSVVVEIIRLVLIFKISFRYLSENYSYSGKNINFLVKNVSDWFIYKTT